MKIQIKCFNHLVKFRIFSIKMFYLLYKKVFIKLLHLVITFKYSCKYGTRELTLDEKMLLMSSYRKDAMKITESSFTSTSLLLQLLYMLWRRAASVAKSDYCSRSESRGGGRNARETSTQNRQKNTKWNIKQFQVKSLTQCAFKVSSFKIIN